MTDLAHPPDSPPAGDPDDATPAQLERTARSRSWLWSAAAVVGVLIVVVAIGRIGQTATGLPVSTSRVTNHSTRAPVAPDRSLTLVRRPVGPSSPSQIGPRVGIRFEGDRFVDGIPAVLDGEPVVRVRDAIVLPEGSAVLVGGWTRRRDCAGGIAGTGVCPAALSDLPFRSQRAAELDLVGQASFESAEGPRVFRATVQSDSNCGDDACLPQLSVGDALWSGDSLTTTSPIQTAIALEGLETRFPTLDFAPFEEASSCPVRWPFQSYLVSTAETLSAELPGLPIRLVVLYPSVADLADESPAARNGAAGLTRFDAANRCVSLSSGVDESEWVVLDNAMVLLGADDPGVLAEVNEALVDAIATD